MTPATAAQATLRLARHVEMGHNKQSRNFFNYGQAKRFMQTMLVASKCKELVEMGKTASIRQIYYLAKHTIKGTNEKTFDDQSESDPVIEDLEGSASSPPTRRTPSRRWT